MERKFMITVPFSLCISNKSKVVLQQNNVCTELCGNKVGAICKEGCRLFLDQEKQFQAKRFIRYKGDYYNLIFQILADAELVILIKQDFSSLCSQFDNLGSLTKKEMEVFQLLLQGLRNSEIEISLKICKSTLKSHINRIYQKLGRNLNRF